MFINKGEDVGSIENSIWNLNTYENFLEINKEAFPDIFKDDEIAGDYTVLLYASE